jgi:hypothetical protein
MLSGMGVLAYVYFLLCFPPALPHGCREWTYRNEAGMWRGGCKPGLYPGA